VPAPIPVAEGFTYYLRGDVGYGWSGKASLSENGDIFGNGPGVFTSATPFAFGGTPFTSQSTDADGVFGGTIGFGAYFTPRFRGDVTLDFRGKQTVEFNGAYSYTSTGSGNTVNGLLSETMKMSSTIGMINGYIDLLRRGAITPYLGAGIGFAYNDVDRAHANTETEVDGLGAPISSQTTNASGKDSKVVLAAALMAGVSFSVDPRWVVDVNYRALFMDGGTSVSFTLPTGELSKATIGDQWEHQVRVGLRVNLW
jgi:opacity protein-like surface antigen